MAWNPNPEIAVAREAARKLNAQQAIVVYILEDGRFGMASYGENKTLCAEAGKLGDTLFEATQEWLMENR